MADKRFQHGQNPVGSGHASLADNLNALLTVECDSDGKGKYRYLKNQTSAPSTAAGEIVFYAKGGKPYFRNPSNGAEVALG